MTPFKKFLLAPLCLGITIYSASPRKCGEQISDRAPSSHQVSIWNYSDSFDTAQYLDLTPLNEKGYVAGFSGTAHISGNFQLCARSAEIQIGRIGITPNPVQCEIESESAGPTLLHRNQHFSLQVMEQSGYIDSKVRNIQSTLSEILRPEQVIFFELTSDLIGKELLDDTGKLPDHIREEHFSRGVSEYFSHFAGFEDPGEGERTYRVKQATAWLISGQPNRKQEPLVLEAQPLKQKIDRKKYPFIWEVGRAAQIEPGAFFEAGSLAAYFMARELILLGGEIDEAYLFAYALTRKVGRGYKLRYKMRNFSEYENSNTAKALVAPLEKILESADLTEISPKLRKLVATSENKLSPFEALKIKLYIDQNRTEYLNDTSGDSLQIRDFSALRSNLALGYLQQHYPWANETLKTSVEELASELPSKEHRDLTAHYAHDSQNPYSTMIEGIEVKRNSQSVVKRVELQELDEFLIEQNAIEVFSESVEDPITLLVIAYRNAIKKLVATGDKNPEATLQSLGVNFVLYNHSIDLPKVAKWYVYRPEVRTLEMAFALQHTRILRRQIYVRADAYSADTVAKLAQKMGDLDFSRGNEHLRQYSKRLDFLRL